MFPSTGHQPESTSCPMNTTRSTKWDQIYYFDPSILELIKQYNQSATSPKIRLDISSESYSNGEQVHRARYFPQVYLHQFCELGGEQSDVLHIELPQKILFFDKEKEFIQILSK